MSFSISLYLNHFFHDHRSVCRIFVSNRMQTIKDLQDHISKIFNIKNFVLMAQNHYLPSVENVMILNRGDIITAVPLQTTSGMCTSTPFSNNQPTLDIAQNSSRIQDSSSDSDIEEVPKKRKKAMATCQKPDILVDSLKDSTPLVGTYQKKIPDENTDVTSRNEKKLKKYNLLNQDLQEPCSSKKNTEIEDSSVCKEKKSKHVNESIREKVMYFENKDATVADLQQNKSKLLDKSNDNSSSSPNEVDISDMMRKHKLFVKSNSSRAKISMELPKQHNIVKSIIVKNSSHNSSGFKSIETSLHSKTDVISNDDTKTSSFTYETPIKFDNGTLDKQKSFIKEKTIKLDNVNNNNSKSVVENSFTNNKSIKFHKDNTKSFESLKIDDDISAINENRKTSGQASEKPKILQNIILQEGVDNKTGEIRSQESKETTKNVTNDIEMTEIEIPLSNLSMETGSVVSNVSTNGSTSLDQVFTQHVTKRKRVRKHKNRKSKDDSIETVPVKPNYEYKLKLPKLPAPVLHIRFDENEDNAASENKAKNKDVAKETMSCDNSENNIEIDGQNDPEMEIQREIIEDEEIVVDNCSALNENFLQADENIELVDCSVYERDFFSHVSKTVESCPLMLNPPEVGNIISFKILKITGSYTPEVSNYIIGKVMNVSEDQNTIMINILDGLEETRTPMGKFSLSTEEEEDLCAYQEYEWHSIMEKRLVSK